MNGRRQVIGIAGLGQIGGSIAQGLIKHGWITHGFEVDPHTAARARRDGVVIHESIQSLLLEVDVLALATPLESYAEFTEILHSSDPKASEIILTDVGSARKPFESLKRGLAETRFRFVGAHPMAGSENNGYANARPDLFDGAAVALIVADDTRVDCLEQVLSIWQVLGSEIVPVSVDDHDRVIARVSHIPHVLAAAIARCAGDGESTALALALAAGSFADGTRVSGSNPRFVAEMCMENHDAVIEATERIAEDLARITTLLRSGNRAELEAFFALAQHTRTMYSERLGSIVPRSIEIDATNRWQSTLRQLGRIGGRIVRTELQGTKLNLDIRLPL